ncbi:MAG: LuxR C-terminal-related transcriptional regulator [Candidatus Cryptobacteroides sp.]
MGKKEIDNLHLSPAMKMADLLNIDFRLLGVSNRMGISFGFKEQTVEQTCSSNGVDTLTFLLICRLYAFNSLLPGKELLVKANIPDILGYLRRSHSYYMNIALKDLSRAIEKMTANCDWKLCQKIWEFYSNYRIELAKHFKYEEEEVFPYVEAVLEHKFVKGFSISQYGRSHSDVDRQLEILEFMVMEDMPQVCDQQDIYKALSCIYALRDDLRMHTAVEDDILIPLVSMLEGSDREAEELLSSREKEILAGVAQGLLNKEIADKYNISINTVITHRKNISRKTGIKTIAGLTMYALLNDLIEIKDESYLL